MATLEAGPAPRTATYVSGGINFSPSVTLKAPVAARDGEPSNRVDFKGNAYVSGIRGVPAGVDLWFLDLAQASGTFDPQLRHPAYRGQPDSFPLADVADVGADGGGDVDLAVGFSITEGIVANFVDIDRIDVVRQSRGIELQIGIPAANAKRLEDRRRGLNARTGCGLCGIEAIDEVLKAPPPVSSRATFTYEALWRAAAELEAKQPINNETRAVHAAAFADRMAV